MIIMMNNFKPYLFEPEKDISPDSDGFNQCIF